MIINLDEKQLNIIGKYLGQAPFNEVVQLIQHINIEVQNNFNSQVDARDIPSGQITPKDEFAGD